MSEPQIPDPWVEAAAEAIWKADGFDLNADPDSFTARELRPGYTEQARAALSAVYPLMVGLLKAEAWDEGADHMLEVMNGLRCEPSDCNPYRADALEEEAWPPSHLHR